MRKHKTLYRCRPFERLLALAVLLPMLMLPVETSAQAEPEEVAANAIDSAAIMAVAAPVTNLLATDHIYDNGEGIDLTWTPSIDDVPTSELVTGYQLYRNSGGGEYVKVADFVPGTNNFHDETCESDSVYTYYMLTVTAGEPTRSVTTAPHQPEVEWLNFGLGWLFLIAVIIGSSVIIFIETARRGTKLFVRKIAGLEAVDEAIGRATEMGRPILFIPGIHDMDDVQTLAAITILGRVARTVANYDTKISMPVARSLVMTAARETIKASYMAAGRPDAYSDDMVNYITDEQFGYVAAVDGIMVREKPATIFLLGAFFAESLILAETGNSVGAIQIAGTARPAQLPFFIAACDFTLIGEELFAASAYLSGDPKSLGSLKGQDVGKGIAMAFILIGAIAATMAAAWEISFMGNLLDWLTRIFTA